MLDQRVVRDSGPMTRGRSGIARVSDLVMVCGPRPGTLVCSGFSCGADPVVGLVASL